MTDSVLLHLIEPPAWRSALSRGAVRPPSLETLGFVHLSTPEQVHLPAEALFPGRRDMVLLVVDPARLTDPVRWESGTPSDPEGMRFPHLYGPLPVAAVVAVVPYRPPAVPTLPAPDDPAGRALALHGSVPIRRAAEVRDLPGGVAVLDPRFRHSRDDNRLLLGSPVEADTVERTAATLARDAGWPHLAASLAWPAAADVARELAGRDWQASELVLMARPAAPMDGGTRAEVADQHEVHGLWERSWRHLLGGRVRDLDEVVGQLIGREERTDTVLAVHDIVVRETGQVVAAGQLRMDGATAAVDSVLTDAAFRGRGCGRAVLARAVSLAAEAGCDLVILEAVADDWPRHWYERAGFRRVASVWDVARPTSSAANT